jgi:hypothetical protein
MSFLVDAHLPPALGIESTCLRAERVAGNDAGRLRSISAAEGLNPLPGGDGALLAACNPRPTPFLCKKSTNLRFAPSYECIIHEELGRRGWLEADLAARGSRKFRRACGGRLVCRSGKFISACTSVCRIGPAYGCAWRWKTPVGPAPAQSDLPIWPAEQ